jgi:hypothetical protein
LCSQLVPHTQQWLDYWTVRTDKVIDAEEIDEKLPIESCGVLINAADGEFRVSR